MLAKSFKIILIHKITAISGMILKTVISEKFLMVDYITLIHINHQEEEMVMVVSIMSPLLTQLLHQNQDIE
jgi:hypothetical protein